MLHVALKMARHHLAALLAVALAVLGGVASLTVAGVLAETGLRSHPPADRLGGADVVVFADQTVRPPQEMPIGLPERRVVPADLIGRLSRVPGVTAAIGDLSFPAAVVGPRGKVVPVADPEVTGHGWSSTGLLAKSRIDGRPPAGSAEVAVDSTTAAAAGLRRGQQVEVIAAGHSVHSRITAVVHHSPAGVYFSDAAAARFAGRDVGPRAATVDLLGLRAAPDQGDAVTVAVRDALRGTGLSVSTGPARGDAAAPGAAAARSTLLMIAGSLAGTILLIVAFVVTSASAGSAEAQRRDLALLRAVGATPRQIRRLAVSQATVVTAAALVPGVAAGYLLAARFRRLLAEAGVIPDDLPLALSPLPAVVAALVIVAVAELSTRSAVWRTSRMSATEAVRESHVEPRAPSPTRTSAGLLLIVAAMTLSVVPLLSRTQQGAAATSVAGILAAIGLGLCGPALVRRSSRVLARRLPTRVSAATWLAVSNTRSYAVRVAGASPRSRWWWSSSSPTS